MLHILIVLRYVIFISGLAHVTLPNGTDEAWVRGGKYGILIAADTASASEHGHITTYPSAEDTIALQIPFADGKIPAHTALYSGPVHIRSWWAYEVVTNRRHG
jgi:hypothetical protein